MLSPKESLLQRFRGPGLIRQPLDPFNRFRRADHARFLRRILHYLAKIDAPIRISYRLDPTGWAFAYCWTSATRTHIASSGVCSALWADLPRFPMFTLRTDPVHNV